LGIIGAFQVGSELAKRRLSREEVVFAARRALEGAPQTTIAAELNVTQGSVSKALKRYYRNQVARLDPDVEKMRLLDNFEGIRQVALEGYRASLHPTEKIQERIRSNALDEHGQPTQTIETIITRSAPTPNAKLLSVAMDASREMGRILGLTPEEERLRALEKERLDAAEARRKNGPFAVDFAAIRARIAQEQPPGITTLAGPVDDALDNEEREVEVMVAINNGTLELAPESWEVVLAGISRECWDRLLPAMPPVFREEMRAAAFRQIQQEIEAERLRRGLPPLPRMGTSSPDAPPEKT
jgi:hypothetical protein